MELKRIRTWLLFLFTRCTPEMWEFQTTIYAQKWMNEWMEMNGNGNFCSDLQKGMKENFITIELAKF